MAAAVVAARRVAGVTVRAASTTAAAKTPTQLAGPALTTALQTVPTWQYKEKVRRGSRRPPL